MKRQPFRGLGAILFKEFIVVWRDPMTLFFMFFSAPDRDDRVRLRLDNDVKHIVRAYPERRSHRREPPVDRSFREHANVSRGGRGQSLEEMKSEMRKGRAYVGFRSRPPSRAILACRTFRAGAIAGRMDRTSTTALQAASTQVSGVP
jgi:hypothetical protein